MKKVVVFALYHPLHAFHRDCVLSAAHREGYSTREKAC
jgi:hypothetical protein